MRFIGFSTAFFLIFLISTEGISQVERQYKPSMSDLSGNGPTLDGKGYIYNFNGDQLTNCNNPESYNQFQNKNYSYALENGSFILKFNGQQEKTDLLCNHFWSDNCFFIEKSQSGSIDLSNHSKIELKVKSDVNVEKFGIYIISVNQEGFAVIGDGDEHTSYQLKADKWTIIKTDAVLNTWNGNALDANRIIGIGLYAKNSDGLEQPKGSIEIDYIRIGSAVNPFEALGMPNDEGYTYSFLCNEDHFCTTQINTLNNSIFNLSIDYSSHDAILKQELTSSKYNLFAIEFTDRDCFLQSINLTNKTYRFVEIKIKPDIDIHSFSISISGNKIDNKEWDYSIPERSVELKGGEWNIIKVPVGLISNSGPDLNPAEIGGIALAFNPHTKESNNVSSITYLIDYIKIGKDVLDETKK